MKMWAWVRSFAEFLASIRLAGPLNRRTYGNSTARAREKEREQVPDLTAQPFRDRIFNRVAIIQHAPSPNLGPRASLVPDRRER